eukprot:scaffold17543_cov99-Isochrysis_galbana.AAC.2
MSTNTPGMATFFFDLLISYLSSPSGSAHLFPLPGACRLGVRRRTEEKEKPSRRRRPSRILKGLPAPLSPFLPLSSPPGPPFSRIHSRSLRLSNNPLAAFPLPLPCSTFTPTVFLLSITIRGMCAVLGAPRARAGRPTATKLSRCQPASTHPYRILIAFQPATPGRIMAELHCGIALWSSRSPSPVGQHRPYLYIGCGPLSTGRARPAGRTGVCPHVLFSEVGLVGREHLVLVPRPEPAASHTQQRQLCAGVEAPGSPRPAGGAQCGDGRGWLGEGCLQSQAQPEIEQQH